jgi:hypothetical protein
MTVRNGYIGIEMIAWSCNLPGTLAHRRTRSLSCLRRRSAWASTFVVSLRLAKQGNVALGEVDFAMTPL